MVVETPPKHLELRPRIVPTDPETLKISKTKTSQGRNFPERILLENLGLFGGFFGGFLPACFSKENGPNKMIEKNPPQKPNTQIHE